jgi:hypothetical protein
MIPWVNTQNSINLVNQFNERFPNRDKASDGTIGDTAHQAETSGHNPDDKLGSRPAWDGDPDNVPEVRARDIDSDLGDPSCDMQDVVNHLCKLPDFESVCRYLIYNRKMYHSRDNFRPTDYSGASAHTEHLHFEGAWSQAADNNVTFNFRLEEVGTVDLSDNTIDKLSDAIADKLMHSDTVPYTATDGTKDTWQLATAVGYLLGKTRDTALNTAAIAKNTNPPDAPAK